MNFKKFKEYMETYNREQEQEMKHSLFQAGLVIFFILLILGLSVVSVWSLLYGDRVVGGVFLLLAFLLAVVFGWVITVIAEDRWENRK